MAHRKSLEALNTTLKDMKNSTDLMDGIIVLLAGDQIATPAEEIDGWLKSSSLWSHVQRISLSINMRVHLYGDSSAQNFTETLLQVGNEASAREILAN